MATQDKKDIEKIRKALIKEINSGLSTVFMANTAVYSKKVEYALKRIMEYVIEESISKVEDEHNIKLFDEVDKEVW